MKTMLTAMIRMYQDRPGFNRLVRRSVRLHHAIARPELRPCPFQGGCSKAGLAQVQTMGAVAAAPLILSRMAHCSPGVDRAEWCISMGTGIEGCWHEHGDR